MTDDKPLIDRVETLEQRVAELEEQLSTDSDSSVSQSDRLDRYDAAVIEMIEADFDHEPSVNEIIRLYQEAGVRDRSKIKTRHKHLKQTGRIDEAVEEEG